LAEERRNGDLVVIKFTKNILERKILKILNGRSHIVNLIGTLRKVPESYEYGLVMPKYDHTADMWRGGILDRCNLMHQLFQAKYKFF
jgi:hypothetical protein